MTAKTAEDMEDTAEDAEDAEAEGAVLAAGEDLAQGKCTRQPAQTAGRSARCHSSRPKAGLFIAGIATKNIRNSRA